MPTIIYNNYIFGFLINILLLARILTFPNYASITHKKLLGASLVFIGAICFSTKAILVKLAYHFPIDSVSLLSLRMVFSLPFFLLIGYFTGTKEGNISMSKKDWVSITGLGIIGYYLSSFLDFEGLKYITAGMERLILFIYPTIVVIITAIFYKKPVKKIQIVALCLTYTGIILAFSFDTNISGQRDFLKGGLLIFLCAITYAIFIFGSGKLIPKLGAIKFTAYAMSISGLAIFLHFAIINEGGLFSFNKEIYFYSFLMAVFATVIPSFMISEGIRLIGSDNASIVSSIGPISTIILAYIFLNETISAIQILGTIFVLGGVLLISTKKER